MSEIQDLFDESLAHIRRQGRPSVGPNTDENRTSDSYICRYRGDGDMGCAAAPFILNYRKGMEGNGWCSVVDNYAASEGSLDPRAVIEQDFVRELQAAHDRSGLDYKPDGEPIVTEPGEFMRKYEYSMKGLAAKYELTYTEAT